MVFDLSAMSSVAHMSVDNARRLNIASQSNDFVINNFASLSISWYAGDNFPVCANSQNRYSST